MKITLWRYKDTMHRSGACNIT